MNDHLSKSLSVSILCNRIKSLNIQASPYVSRRLSTTKTSSLQCSRREFNKFDITFFLFLYTAHTYIMSFKPIHYTRESDFHLNKNNFFITFSAPRSLEDSAKVLKLLAFDPITTALWKKIHFQLTQQLNFFFVSEITEPKFFFFSWCWSFKDPRKTEKVFFFFWRSF